MIKVQSYGTKTIEDIDDMKICQLFRLMVLHMATQLADILPTAMDNYRAWSTTHNDTYGFDVVGDENGMGMF